MDINMDLTLDFPFLESVNSPLSQRLLVQLREKVCLQHVHMLTLISFNNTYWLRGFLCLLKKLTIICLSAQPARWVSMSRNSSFLLNYQTSIISWSLDRLGNTQEASSSGHASRLLCPEQCWITLILSACKSISLSRALVRALKTKHLAKPDQSLLAGLSSCYASLPTSYKRVHSKTD